MFFILKDRLCDCVAVWGESRLCIEAAGNPGLPSMTSPVGRHDRDAFVLVQSRFSKALAEDAALLDACGRELLCVRFFGTQLQGTDQIRNPTRIACQDCLRLDCLGRAAQGVCAGACSAASEVGIMCPGPGRM